MTDNNNTLRAALHRAHLLSAIAGEDLPTLIAALVHSHGATAVTAEVARATRHTSGIAPAPNENQSAK